MSEDTLARWIANVAGRHNQMVFARVVDKATMQRLGRYGPAPYGIQIGKTLYVRDDLCEAETRSVLLHELAHLLCPPTMGNMGKRTRRRDIHSWAFWEMFWDLAEEEGMVEECLPYIYMKRGIKVYEQRKVTA